jgi:prepilin-type N-terminal cleavage/methylation domain-containing protein
MYINDLVAVLHMFVTARPLREGTGAMGVPSMKNEIEYTSNKDQGGFTLTELVIVVAIIGLASALAVPKFLETIRTYQLKEATLEVANILTTARMAAMNRNRTVTVSLAATGGVVNITAAESSSGVHVMPMATAMGQVNQVSGGPISFNSLGMRTTGSGGTQLVALSTVSNQTYSVVVAASGKVYPCFATSCP